MMNELILQYKQDYLAGLKEAKKKIEAKAGVRQNQIYADKAIGVTEKSANLDQALQNFIKDEQSKLDAKITAQREAVAAKKQELEAQAVAEAELEAKAEVKVELDEIEREIKKVETEIGG